MKIKRFISLSYLKRGMQLIFKTVKLNEIYGLTENSDNNLKNY